MLGANQGVHSFASITTYCSLITGSFWLTIRLQPVPKKQRVSGSAEPKR